MKQKEQKASPGEGMWQRFRKRPSRTQLDTSTKMWNCNQETAVQFCVIFVHFKNLPWEFWVVSVCAGMEPVLHAKTSALPLSHIPIWLRHVIPVLNITSLHPQRYWQEVVGRNTTYSLIFFCLCFKHFCIAFAIILCKFMMSLLF